MARPPDEVAIIGSGTMGPGLAVQFARHGSAVTLIDHRKENLEQGRRSVTNILEFLSEESLLAGTSAEVVKERIGDTVDTAAGVSDAELILETVSEDRQVKREVFNTVVAAAPQDALLASNTSGIPITDLAASIPDPGRVVGCHWWNPPYLMPLVEVVRGKATTDRTVSRIRDYVEAVDRDPIVVERDVPGFVWNRIQFAVLRECVHLVEEGVASVSDVERAVRDGYALRTAAVGPFETADLSGLDLFRDIAADLFPHLSDADDPGAVFEDRIEAGRTGVAAGEGFHRYQRSLAEAVRHRDHRIAAIQQALDGPRGQPNPRDGPLGNRTDQS